MGSKRLLACLAIVVMVFFGFTKADINKDKEQCADKLVGLATCLPYAAGEAKAPTKDCCTGLNLVLSNSKVCLCILVKDHNDPSLGLKINDTLALSLPDICRTPTNISECLSLLHLQPGSPDAKVFDDFSKGTKSKNTTIVQPGDATKAKAISSDGKKRELWLGLKIVALVFIIEKLHFHVSNDIDNYYV